MTVGDDEALQQELTSTQFEYVRRIAQGGMGQVIEVAHRALRYPAVMKLLKEAEPSVLEDMTRRLLREGRVLTSVRHPNILQVMDFGFTAKNRPYLVSELLVGKTLKQEIAARGPLPVSEIVEVMAQILAGLEHAHDKGLVHRDLKPDNIMWLDADSKGSRHVKILDFGIVKIVDEGMQAQVGGVQPTVPGYLLGTPAYLAPEQAIGGPIDVRTDLYAMGGVLFYLLTGRQPFSGKDMLEVLRAHLSSPPTPPSRLRADVPPLLDDVVVRALQKKREARFSSASEMRDALHAAIKGQTTATAPLPDVVTKPLPARTPSGVGPLVGDKPVGGRVLGPRSTVKMTESEALAARGGVGVQPQEPEGTLYETSPLGNAKSAHVAPRDERAIVDEPRGEARASQTDRAERAIAPRSIRQPPQRPWLYVTKIVVISLVLALATVGLFHMIGLDP